MQHYGRNGFLFALCGFALLSMGDAVIKSMAGEWPGTAVAALRFCIGAIGLGVILWMKEGKAGFKIPLPKFQLLRGFGLAASSLCFFSAIYLMPLAEAVAIQFTGPMMTALISAVFLGERTSKATWIASLVAFGGVVLILRPNVEILGWAAFLPLGAAFTMALVMIGNRAVAGSGSALQMQFLIAAISAPLLLLAATIGHFSGIVTFQVNMLDWSILARCALVAVTASISHSLVYLGTTRTSAAQIAPAVFVQILIAIALGVIFFGDLPDMLSVIGSAVIILAGIFLWRSNAVTVVGSISETR
jgi:drug/metabolite transporter (DMT)-like permease